MASDTHHERGDPDYPAFGALDGRERQFYAVMHHVAAVVWTKGKAVEALAALGAVLGWAAQEERDNGSAPRP
jgi:hypothetical protein